MTAAESKLFSPPFTKSLFDWWLIAGLMATAPLLLRQAQFLGERPHFQFFPMAVIFFIAMIVMHRRPTYTTSPLRIWIGSICLFAYAMLASLAALLFSPWLAQLSATLLCFGWMIVRLGGNPWHQLVAWISVLVIIVPPPRELDQLFIQRLQLTSTIAASKLLDMTAVPHVASGNILETRAGKMFVDQACSGIDSLYSLAAIALMFIIWNRQSLVSSLLLLVSVPVWAVFGNLLRIFTIVYVLDRFDIDLTHGWQHTLIGLVLFTASSVGLLLTQTAISGLIKPFPFRATEDTPFHKLYNRLVCWPAPDPIRAATKATESTAPVPASLGMHATSRIVFTMFGFATCLIVGLGTARQMLPSAQASASNAGATASASVITNAKVDEVLTANLMPQDWMGMSQIGFATDHREIGSNYGDHSATWSYSDGNQTVVISADFPFLNSHALEICYENSGNTLEKPIFGQPASLPSGERVTIYEIRMQNQLQIESFVWYVCCKQNRESPQFVTELAPFQRGAFAGLGDTTAQFQIYVEGSGPLTPEQIARYKKCLLDMIDRLFPSVASVLWTEP